MERSILRPNGEDGNPTRFGRRGGGRKLVLLAPALLALPAPTLDQDDEPIRAECVLSVGRRTLDEDDWAPLEEQLALGVELVGAPSEEHWAWELGLAHSEDEVTAMGADLHASTLGVHAGLRRWIGSSALRPYFAGGVTAIYADLDTSDGWSYGGYGRVGLSLAVADRLSLGVDARYAFVRPLGLDDPGVDLDGFQVAVTLGIGL